MPAVSQRPSPAAPVQTWRAPVAEAKTAETAVGPETARASGLANAAVAGTSPVQRTNEKPSAGVAETVASASSATHASAGETEPPAPAAAETRWRTSQFQTSFRPPVPA